MLQSLQVTDHIREVAKHTNIRVIAIVGGMSTEKQERLLKRRPEIVVGTPGRLWELMSGGEVHLVEVSHQFLYMKKLIAWRCSYQIPPSSKVEKDMKCLAQSLTN